VEKSSFMQGKAAAESILFSPSSEIFYYKTLICPVEFAESSNKGLMR